MAASYKVIPPYQSRAYRRTDHRKYLADAVGFEQFAAAVQQVKTAEGLTDEQAADMVCCYLDVSYFVRNYIQIYDTVAAGWISFDLWPEQADVLYLFATRRKVVVLKSRQVGITWLALSFILWEAIFRPPSSALILSKRDPDAMYLLGVERLRGMFNLLPKWMQPEITKDDAHVLSFQHAAGVSSIRAMSTTSGDSYTATTVLVDEADLLPDLSRVLLAVEPTVNAGGRLLLVSKSDRSRPQTTFKGIYKAARDGRDPEWSAAFLPWFVHPGRDRAWYERQVASALETEGSIDPVYESYPTTDAEALSLKKSDRRLSAEWLANCWYEQARITDKLAVYRDDLRVYARPVAGRMYSIGVDCAEGLPHSDYSTAVVLDALTGESVAVLQGRLPPDQHAVIVERLSRWYNGAPVLFERNNHGQGFLVAADVAGLSTLAGPDGRTGWPTTAPSKAYLYDELAAALREQEVRIYDLDTFNELGSIEASTLKCPPGEGKDRPYDDLAVAFALANYARRFVYAAAANEQIESFNARDW